MLAMACPTTWRILLTFLGHAREWESGRRVVVDRLPRFAPPSRGSSRVEAAEAILARVSDGPGEPPGGASWKAAASRAPG